MPTLHLGVIDTPYGGRSKSTGEVAEILEHKYGLFSAFVEMHQPVIEHVIENSIQGHIETLMMGGPSASVPAALNTATSELETLFKDSLTMQSYDFKLAGVPTQAALRGIRHRMRRAYLSARDPRPSFIDTGLLQSSFKAWTS